MAALTVVIVAKLFASGITRINEALLSHVQVTYDRPCPLVDEIVALSPSR